MASIIFLGTGGDEFVVGKQLRASGGMIIQVEGYQFHVDPGPGALVRAKQAGVNPRENTAVLVSHAHINHCNDVNAVLAAMSRNGFDINGVLISNSTFINGNEEARMTPMLTDFHKNCVERIIVAKPGQRIGIEAVEIQTLKAFHKDPGAMGFKFITPKFTLTYSGDTSYNKELIEQYKKSDILVLNLVYPEGVNEKNADNLCFDDAVKIIEKTNPQLAVITHFGKKAVESDPIDTARELQKATGVQIIAATDGMSINPTTYSADAKQRTLGAYKEPVKEEKEKTEEEKTEEPAVEEREEVLEEESSAEELGKEITVEEQAEENSVEEQSRLVEDFESEEKPKEEE